MKKTKQLILPSLLAGILSASLLLAAPQADAATFIDARKAQEIALSHAGVAENTALGLRVKQDHDDGRLIYEVKFSTQDTGYEYEVDAANGEIIEYEKKHHFMTRQNMGSHAAYMSEEDALALAIKKVGLTAKDVKVIKTSSSFKKGRRLYEFTFVNQETKFKFEINAANGEVLEFSRKNIYLD